MTAHTITTVPGTIARDNPQPQPDGRALHITQVWTSEARKIRDYGPGARMVVKIRFDDQCKNGHQTFAITADVENNESRRHGDIAAGGCLHDDIEKVFPELAPLIRWHLCSTDGPMHYRANTIYLAGDRDYNGLRAGESRQIRNGKTGLPCWILDGPRTQYQNAEQCPDEVVTLRWQPLLQHGKGKSRQLGAARNTAIWPDATDAQLCLPPDELGALLDARLPALLAEFRATMDSIGMAWEPPAE